MSNIKSTQKPLLRGYLHQEAFYTTLGACALLIAKANNNISIFSSIIYSFGLLFLFGISAFYHRPQWSPKSRALLKKLDHCAIFILIASTFTPICFLALPAKEGHQLLLVVWIAAVAGIFQSVFWVKAPKIVTAVFYVVMGWFALPYISELKDSLGTNKLALVVLGGVAYTVGAVFYATKRPRLRPEIFGYHELFHLLTIVGALLHFIVIYQLI
jgi:hemolysin III